MTASNHEQRFLAGIYYDGEREIWRYWYRDNGQITRDDGGTREHARRLAAAAIGGYLLRLKWAAENMDRFGKRL